MTPRVAVIGGGWAGCTAALTLAEAGVSVTLFEASRTLGGRARAVEIEGEALDNGQHILLGAYEQTLALIARLHPAALPQVLWRLPLTINLPPDFYLACPRLPAPLHLLAGLFGATGLTWREKRDAARWAYSLLHGTETVDMRTVSQLTATQPETINRLLWHPLCISALNTPPEKASAQVFRDVMLAAFGRRRHHSDLLLPRCDLTSLLPAPAAARILDRGGNVKLSSRVSLLAATDETVTVGTAENFTHFSHVILAVAPQHLAGLAASVPALASLARTVERYRYQSIGTAYVQYDRAFRLPQAMLALADGPAQFVFDRGQSHGQSGLLAFVASAATNLTDGWIEHAEAQLHRSIQPGKCRWRRSIVEKQASYSCEPLITRPSVETAHPRIFLAGDYTASLYPATLESASLSGVQSAGALLKQL